MRIKHHQRSHHRFLYSSLFLLLSIPAVLRGRGIITVISISIAIVISVSLMVVVVVMVMMMVPSSTAATTTGTFAEMRAARDGVRQLVRF